MSDAKLRELVVKRSSVKGRLTKFKNFLAHCESLKSADEIEQTKLSIQLGKIESLSGVFDEIQSQIEVLNHSELEDEIEERDSIELEFASLIATAQQFQSKHSQAGNPSVDVNSSSHCCHEQTGIGFKPPTLQIGKFDGNYNKWLEFRDLYCSLVHDNNRIPTPIKFCYLNSYLEGEASRVISNLEVTEANYNKAWDLLRERYDNKRLLIKSHLNSLLNLSDSPDIKSSESDKVLRSIVDNVNKNLRALSSLGEPTSHWDTLIIHIVSSKLASQTSMKWEEYRNSIPDTPTLEQFTKFLKDRADILETYNHPRSTSNFNRESNINNNIRKRRPQANVFTAQISDQSETVKAQTLTCEVCKGAHRIYDCENFKSKTIEQRQALVNSLKLCRNCLRAGHSTFFCRAGPCRKCRKRHNSLICKNNQQLAPQDSALTPTATASTTVAELTVNLARDNVNKVTLLSTALVEAFNPVNKRSETVRILLDCGAESSFISKGLQDRLELQSTPMEPVNLIGIGNSTSHCTNELCSFQLKSLHSDYVAKLTCPVLPELTGDIPRLSINTSNLKIPTHVQLADPSFHKPSPIDVLVGADLFWHVVGCERQSLGANKPYLINSEFGWILSGPIFSGTRPTNLRCNFQSSESQSADDLNKLLNRFWDLEEFSPKKLLSEDEKACEEHFQVHTTRDPSGRFCVRLPLKDSPDCLGNSYITARKRFFNLERRFKAQPELKAQYVEFINEYLKLGHCSILNVARVEPSYFLCHHAVFKQQSESTKLRVVFDASCSTSSGFSINDLQYVGPTVQDTLFSILLRFRQHRYVLTGDIEKMFRQVTVHESDRNLQLILWRDNEQSTLKILRLNTVTYGFASASYLSTKCLWRLGEECEDELIKTVIQRDFYMDDLLTGADTISDLRHILSAVVSVLRSGCFPLRKFKSNVPSIFENSLIDPLENLTLSESTSTLGLQWKPPTDTLNIVVNIPEHSDDYTTKRLILSHSFKIYDPLGLISPCTIRAKVLMQELWRRNINWDEPVPCDLQQTWDELKQDLSKLEFIEIPRLALCSSPVSLELHSFCDASAVAHGCCLYLRSVDYNGEVVVRLLCAKSRVNPSKPITIPRLELLSALLAARLCKSTLESLRCTISRTVHWSDSSVVLGWLRTNPSKLKTFVANRVVEICETTTPANWRHVPTNHNPADLISRGTKASNLLDSQLWWSGPQFLSEAESEWPVLGEQFESDLPEIKVHSVQVSENLIIFDRFSNLMRLKRAFAYTLRFIHNVKNPEAKRVGALTVDELSQSFTILCKFAQLQSFTNEYNALVNKRDISVHSNLTSLCPFLDKQNLMRVGGRLENSDYGYDKKHPILLHSKHHLSHLIFRYEHIQQMHAGPQLLLYTVRNYVWPLGGRQLARRTVRNCVRCRRFQGKTVTPLMGPLPSQRTMPAFPFETTGVDFAGPFTILNRKGRGSKVSKCYLCLFICFRYKCVHLEAVTELSKEAFILTLRRFIGRRGKPLEIYSDNGRNFVATAKELANFLKDGPNLLSDFSASEQIKFHFIPVYSPHWAGYWEAGIKSAKHHIKRVMGSSNFTYEELSTLFAQVEAILNSRPLCPISSSPHDLQSLTPGHFLIGRPLTSLPDPTLEAEKTSNLQRYARVEQARQHFWRRWQNEYISELQQRMKWRSNKGNILRVGDLVLLQEESSPPLHWRLGRVKQMFPGSDGIARVAEITTQRGDVRRALTKLCPLLCEAHNEQNVQ